MTQLNERDAENLTVAALDTTYNQDVFVQLSMRDDDGTLRAYAIGTTDPANAQKLEAFAALLPDLPSLGQVGYDWYAGQTGGKTWNGLDMPTWDALPATVQLAWAAAAAGIHAALTQGSKR